MHARDATGELRNPEDETETDTIGSMHMREFRVLN
jgi:hypothetical protein